MRWLLVVAAWGLGVGAQEVALDEAALLASRRIVEAQIADIDAETRALYTNEKELNASLVLRAEEASSLSTRYPGIVVAETDDAQGFRKALEAERLRQLRQLSGILGKLQIIYHDRACASYRAAQESLQKLYASAGYRQQPLATRIELRSAAEAAMREVASDGDPCAPLPSLPEPGDSMTSER